MNGQDSQRWPVNQLDFLDFADGITLWLDLMSASAALANNERFGCSAGACFVSFTVRAFGTPQFNNAWSNAGDVDAFAWTEPRSLQPTSDQTDLWLGTAFPEIAIFLDLECAAACARGWGRGNSGFLKRGRIVSGGIALPQMQLLHVRTSVVDGTFVPRMKSAAFCACAAACTIKVLSSLIRSSQCLM